MAACAYTWPTENIAFSSPFFLYPGPYQIKGREWFSQAEKENSSRKLNLGLMFFHPIPLSLRLLGFAQRSTSIMIVSHNRKTSNQIGKIIHEKTKKNLRANSFLTNKQTYLKLTQQLSVYEFVSTIARPLEFYHLLELRRFFLINAI